MTSRTDRGDAMAAAVAAGETMTSVAKRYGVTVAAVSHVCTRRGISRRRGPKYAERTRKMAELHAAGMPLVEVARSFGVSPQAVHSACARRAKQRDDLQKSTQ
jgi:transposase-like protein